MTDTPGPPTGMSRRTGGWLVALFVGVALAALLSLIHLPYAILKPGPVTNTLGNVRANTPLVSVSDARTYPTSGVLDFTTVAVYGGPQHPVNVWDVLSGLVDRSSHVVPEQTMFPKGTTSKQVQEENAAEMADSQQEAIAVALRATGTKVARGDHHRPGPGRLTRQGRAAGRRRGRERRRRPGRQHRRGPRRRAEAQARGSRWRSRCAATGPPGH